MNIETNPIFIKYQNMLSNGFSEEILNFISHKTISENINNICSLKEYSILSNYLKDNFSNFLKKENISSFFDNLEDLKKFAINHADPKYIDSLMFRNTIYSIIEKNQINDQNEKNRILGTESIVQLLGLEYPDNTCPMIDSVKDDLEEKKNDLNQEIENLHQEISELEGRIVEVESSLEDPNCYFNDEIEECQRQIESNSNKIDENEDLVIRIDADLNDAEDLRTSCEDVRGAISNATNDYKSEIELIKINNQYLANFPEDDYQLMENIQRHFNEPTFDNDFSDAINNLNLIYQLGEEVSDYLKKGLEDDICNHEIISKEVFIDDFISSIKKEKNHN